MRSRATTCQQVRKRLADLTNKPQRAHTADIHVRHDAEVDGVPLDADRPAGVGAGRTLGSQDKDCRLGRRQAEPLVQLVKDTWHGSFRFWTK
jgi:hypothetical protein